LPPNTEINDVKKIFVLITQILKVIFIQHSNKEDQLSIIQIKIYNRVSRRTQREPLTMGKQLVNFITCGCELSAPFFVIYKAEYKPMPYW
jgi:hypothetical protein